MPPRNPYAPVGEARQTARQRGYDRAWQRVRARHLKANPYCVACGAQAVDVDHIQSIRDAPSRRLDATNLQSLCANHHKIITNAHDGWQANGQAGVAGQVDAQGHHLDPRHPWYQGPAMPPGEAKAAMKQANLASNRGYRRK
jgi:5-methylcytosine-specific restriction enzyme A